MARDSKIARAIGRGASCPTCGADLSGVPLSVRPFQCPRCSEWLHLPWYQDALRGAVSAVGAALAAYFLGFRGFAFLFACLVGFWILGVPASVLLGRFLPVHPEKTLPNYAAVGLFGTVRRQPNRDKQEQEEKQDQRQGDDRSDP